MRGTRTTIAVVIMSLAMAMTALAQEIYTRGGSNLALEGMDAVSYFVSGKPVKGRKDLASQYKGAVWRFSSAGNKAAFDKNPQKFAPQYGGHCAYGTAQGYAVRGDPRAWRIVNGKLYLNYNRAVQNKWNRDISSYIAEGNRNWPAVLKTK